MDSQEARPAASPSGRSVAAIRATGAAWVTEAELAWLCDQVEPAEKPFDVSGLDSHDPADALIEEGRFDG